MPNWKKLIVSGSDASLNSLIVATNVNAQSFTGSLFGTASQAVSSSYALSSSYAVSASYALNATTASYALTASGVQGGTANYIPLWTSDTTISSSLAYQTGSMIVMPAKLGVGATATTSSYTSELNITYYPTVNAINTPGTNVSVRNVALSGYTLVTGAPSAGQYGGFLQTETSKSNANNFSGLLIGGDVRATHWGSGIISNLTGIQALGYIYSGSSTGTIKGGLIGAYTYTTGSVTQVLGSHGQMWNVGTGTVTRAWAGDFALANRSTGVITNAMAVGVQLVNESTGTITNAYGISLGGPNDIWSNSGGGTVTNSYGIYISSSIDIGSTRYAIWSDSTSNTYIKGNVGLNTTSPLYNLDVNGSGNFASNLTATGSIKFPSLANTNQVNVVGYDATTGQLYYQTTSSLVATTASYAISSSYALSGSYTLTASGVQGGTTNYIPLWTSDTTISSSQAYQTGNLVVMPGNLGVGPLSTTGSFTSQIPTTYYPKVNATALVDTTNAGNRNVPIFGYTSVTGAPSVTQFGGFLQLETSQSNANNFSGGLVGADLRASHWGSGTIGNVTGVQGLAYIYSGSSTGLIRGGLDIAYSYTTGNVAQTIGTHAQSNNYGTGTVTTAYAIDAFIGNRVGGNMTNAIGVGVQIRNYLGGTITNVYGVSIGGFNDPWGNLGAGSITNSYGLYIDSTIDVGATTRYAIYSDSTSNSYIKGNVGINKTSPVYNLDVNGSGNFASGLTVTGSAVITQNVTASNALITGTITAQTLIVQTVTSSIVYSSGSNIFGNQLTDVQQFTGSLRVTGSDNHWIMGANVGMGTMEVSGALHVNNPNANTLLLQRISPDSGPPEAIGRKARGTDTAKTGVLSGDRLWFFAAAGYYGTEGIDGAWSANKVGMNFVASENWSSTAQGTHITWATTEAGQTTRSDKAILTGAGRFGLNTTTPVSKLDVNGDGNFSANLTATGSIKFPSLTNVNQTNIVSYDTATGQLYYQTTSSLSVASASYAATASHGDSGFTIGFTQIKTGTVASSIAGSNNMFTDATGSFSGAKYLYTAVNGSNARTGEVLAVWTGGSVQYTDYSTVDIGSTTAVTASVSIVSAQAQLNFQTNTSGWTIKSTVTYL